MSSDPESQWISYSAEWVAGVTGRTLTEGQQRAVTVLATTASNGAIYNVPLIGSWQDAADYNIDSEYWDDDDDLHLQQLTPPVEFHERFVIARLAGELATFDGSQLTRLVVAAHEHAVRVAVSARTVLVEDDQSFLWEQKGSGNKAEWVETDRHPRYRQACLEVMLHPRQREGSTWERHPSIEQVLGL